MLLPFQSTIYTVKSLVSRLFIGEAWKEKKLEISKEVETEILAQKKRNKTLDESLKNLEAKRSILKTEIRKLQSDLKIKIKILKSLNKSKEQIQLLKSERNMHCQEVKSLETSVISSSNHDQFMKATKKLKDYLNQSRKLMEDMTIPKSWHGHLTIEVLRGWCQEGPVFASYRKNGTNMYGKVKLVGDRVWVHCFHSRRPLRQAVIVSFRELLTAFNGSLELPKRGFIQVEHATLGFKDVVITTDALTPRAMNFLLLCSGIKGRSYEGIRLHPDDSLIVTPPNVGGAVVKGIKDGDVYEAPARKGFVGGWGVKDTDWLSGFGIWMEFDPSWNLNTKFGVVEEGLDFLRRVHWNKSDILINHCGLVI